MPRGPAPLLPPGGVGCDAPSPLGTVGLSILDLLAGRLFLGELRGGQGKVWDALVFL